MSEPLRVCVIGDAMLDIIANGVVTRMSPEAKDCPVLERTGKDYNLGGAGNVAAWLSTADNMQVSLLYQAGWDKYADTIIDLCGDFNIGGMTLRQPESDNTTVKWRFYSEYCQVLRVDRDTQTELQERQYEQTCHFLKTLRPHAIVVADYDKGMFRGDWGAKLRNTLQMYYELNNTRLFINSKVPDRWANILCTALVCNAEEKSRAWPYHQISDLGSVVNAEVVIVTKGGAGVILKARFSIKECFAVPALLQPGQVVDVSGAGDAFLAGIVTAVMSQRPLFGFDHTMEELGTMLHHAQQTAAQCCQKLGAGPVQKETATWAF